MPDIGLLADLFSTAVKAADPMTALAQHLPEKPKGRTVVIGAGKGAAQLAQAFETLWDDPVSGVVVTRYGYGTECKQIEIIEAAHPVPDDAGLFATEALMAAVKNLGVDDLVVALICGGGSALLPSPPNGLTLADEQALNEVLLASGAPISVMNAIRKNVSGIKGGRLAKLAHPARVVSLIVSDVPGDDPAQVASGPTVPDHVTREQALQLIESLGLSLPKEIVAHIRKPSAAAPPPYDPAFEGNDVKIIASAGTSLAAAAAQAEAQGIPSVILSDAIEGEAREIAKMHAAIALEVRAKDQPFTRPVLILSGGETTVTLRGKGKGGRNTEFLLAFAQAIDGVDGILALAADTDGIDGSEDNAGAFVDGTTCARLRAAGRNPAEDLMNNDAFSAFETLGDLFSPGPTGTNVNDFRAILVRQRSAAPAL